MLTAKKEEKKPWKLARVNKEEVGVSSLDSVVYKICTTAICAIANHEKNIHLLIVAILIF